MPYSRIDVLTFRSGLSRASFLLLILLLGVPASVAFAKRGPPPPVDVVARGDSTSEPMSDPLTGQAGYELLPVEAAWTTEQQGRLVPGKSEACLQARGWRRVDGGGLGHGRFGQVSLVKREADGFKAVAKLIRRYVGEGTALETPAFVNNEIELQNRAAALTSANAPLAPRVIDWWFCRETGEAVIVSEYVEGQTLLGYMKARIGCEGAGGSYDSRDMVAADGRLGGAMNLLEALHQEAQVSHGDFHAENVMVGTLHRDGAPAVVGTFAIDFGHARLRSSVEDARAREADDMLPAEESFAVYRANKCEKLATLLKIIMFPHH